MMNRGDDHETPEIGDKDDAQIAEAVKSTDHITIIHQHSYLQGIIPRNELTCKAITAFHKTYFKPLHSIVIMHFSKLKSYHHQTNHKSARYR